VRVLTIKTAASSLALLTTAEMQAAVGIAAGDHSRDADLDRLSLRVSSAITAACNIRGDGLTPPTLLRETLIDTFYNRGGGFHFWQHAGGASDVPASSEIILSRRRVASVTALKFDDVTVDAAQYILDGPSGLIEWNCLSLSVGTFKAMTVEYPCGFATIPDDLKLAAETYVRALWRDSYATPASIRDPLLKHDEVIGMGTKEYWVDLNREREMPPEVLSMLEDGGYIDAVMA
jgi:hypothetical protein